MRGKSIVNIFTEEKIKEWFEYIEIHPLREETLQKASVFFAQNFYFEIWKKKHGEPGTPQYGGEEIYKQWERLIFEETGMKDPEFAYFFAFFIAENFNKIITHCIAELNISDSFLRDIARHRRN